MDTNLSSAVEAMMQPLAELRERVRLQSVEIEKQFKKTQESMMAFGAPLALLQEQSAIFHGQLKQMQVPLIQADLLSRIFPTIYHASEIVAATRALDDAGWLPHRTLPSSIISKYEDGHEVLRSAVGEYYSKNWSSVRKVIEEPLDKYLVDKEAKDAFIEGLNAHEYGLYRCVPRHLFPEIERMTRIEFSRGQDTSQSALRKLALDLEAYRIEPPAPRSTQFFVRLDEHLYAKVKPDNLDRMTADPIPNRHAAIHGLVTYRSAQSSLNAIFVADFVFQILTALKSSKSEAP